MRPMETYAKARKTYRFQPVSIFPQLVVNTYTANRFKSVRAALFCDVTLNCNDQTSHDAVIICYVSLHLELCSL